MCLSPVLQLIIIPFTINSFTLSLIAQLYFAHQRVSRIV
jgi:hypothetical protein